MIRAALRHRALALVAVLTAGTLLGVGAVCGSGSQTSQEATTAIGTTAADTATAEQPAVAATPEPTRELATLPTAASSDEPMILGGTLWVDARPAVGEVLAFINGAQCGRGQSGILPSEPPSAVSTFVIQVESDSTQPGCGVPGAQVTLTVSGRAMNDSIPWQPGFQQAVSRIAGPPFGTYYGMLTADSIPPRSVVLPYVGDTLCGAILELVTPNAQTLAWSVVVDPTELNPECGRAGAEVQFHLRVEGKPDVVFATEAWVARIGNQLPTADVTAAVR